MSSPDPFTHALRERIDALTAKERAIFGEATSEDIRDVMARRSNLKVHLQPGERVHHLRRYGELLASLLDFLDTVEGRGDPGRRMRQPEVVNNGVCGALKFVIQVIPNLPSVYLEKTVHIFAKIKADLPLYHDAAKSCRDSSPAIMAIAGLYWDIISVCIAVRGVHSQDSQLRATVSSVLPFTNPLSRTLEEVRRNLDTRRPSLKAELEAARTMDILGPYADPSKIPAHTTISNADTCNPTRLPPELWLRIFALAADVPGLMDPAPATSFPYDPWPALETTQWGALHERYREPGRLAHGTFADRFSIYTNAGLACRYFYALVLPELYACVRVTSLAACEALARTLATSQREGGTPLGACVRVAIFDLSSPRRPFSEYDRAYPPLAAIFRCLPRLHTLHFEVSAREEISWHALSHFPEPVDSALRQMCAPTLRKLHWGEHSVVWPAVVWPAPRDRHALLAAAVGLRSLVYDVRLGGCPCRLPVLPELAELTLGCHALNLWGDGACPTTPLPPLPALRALYWRIQDTRLNDTLRACGHLAARQGPLLRSVVLDTPYYVEAEIVGKALATLRAYCTKLKKLTLVVRDWQQLEAAAKGNMPQSVTRLELRFTIDHPRLQNGFPTPIILFEVLKALEMPNLKVVVLLPDDTLRRWLWANAKSTELDVAAVVKSLPFRVEDYEGRLLSEVWL